MREFKCSCGEKIYFDNHSCSNCDRELGFDPRLHTMVVSEPGAELIFCGHRASDIKCNWTADADAPSGHCLSCQTSKIIPSLDRVENRLRWRKLEAAKRRLIYGLLLLNLPVNPSELSFAFKEDRRTNPNVYEEHIATGHSAGRITINAAEADDVFREEMRQIMNEPYRTLLGHFRHESGHYYFSKLVGAEDVDEARGLFGDERVDYSQSLQSHYENGAPVNWRENFVSSYASSHPAEDWAECWAHFLHMTSVLETARAQSIIAEVSLQAWHKPFIDLMLKLNEVSRSLGLPDTYPFVLVPTVVEKIDFIRRMAAKFMPAAD